MSLNPFKVYRETRNTLTEVYAEISIVERVEMAAYEEYCNSIISWTGYGSSIELRKKWMDEVNKLAKLKVKACRLEDILSNLQVAFFGSCVTTFIGIFLIFH